MNSKLLKLSAKYAFDFLRENGPYYCAELKNEVSVNREYWHHLVFQKNRDKKDAQERLLILPLVPEILQKGILSDKRNDYFRIELSIENIEMAIILKKQESKYILLSGFIIYENYQSRKK